MQGFPLTPALSPREREWSGQLLCAPSPLGEGRGEGHSA